MSQVARVIALFTAVAVAGACSGLAEPAASPPVGAAVTASGSATATAAATPTAAAPPTNAPIVPARVLPGEPWIIYVWGVPEAGSVGIVAVRPAGTDEHWAEPEAPIAAGNGAGDGWQLHPDWSPDGSQLAFGIDVWPYEDGHRDIWISDADGHNARRLYDCVAPCDSAHDPAWSRDGKSVLFARFDHANRISDGSSLDLVDVASGEVTTLAQTKGPNYFAHPRWSPDGMRVVVEIETWSNITENSELEYTSVAIVDLTATPATILKISEPSHWATYPDWHPTDDRIVFSRRPEGRPDSSKSELYTMDADGSNATLLVDHDLNAVQPTWLPDGSGVVFVLVSGDDYTTATMWVVDADGSNLRPATATDDAPGGSHPRLRPTAR